jgi:ISGsu1, transposase
VATVSRDALRSNCTSSWACATSPILLTQAVRAGIISSLGIQKELSRSTLSYANTNRSCEVFKKLFYTLRESLDRGGRKKLRKKISMP